MVNGLTPREYFRVYGDELPAPAQTLISDLMDEVEEYENDEKGNKRENEIREEQLYFARELVESLDLWAKANLPKTKLKEYMILRDNTQFEI